MILIKKHVQIHTFNMLHVRQLVLSTYFHFNNLILQCNVFTGHSFLTQLLRSLFACLHDI
jgi:hypothetical protein